MNASAASDYQRNVFVNCPFDDPYLPLLDALIFAVHACGFRMRCALEVQDSSDVRFQKILKIIRERGLGVHDLSRMELDARSGLPRFNMPFELGLFLAARHFGDDLQAQKKSLILDVHPYRYQKALSDIAGQDIESHDANPSILITKVRNWLLTCSPDGDLPGGEAIRLDFEQFQQERPELLTSRRLKDHELTYLDRARLIAAWLVDRARFDELT